MKYFRLTLEDELHQKLKMLSAMLSKPMHEIVVEAITEKIEKEGKK